MYHLFPFDKVSPNSSVIIYGMGNVGKEYYEQIKTSGYCRIVKILDKKYLRSDETLKGILTKERFDFIVIAVANEKVAQEIAGQIRECDVAEEKIVHCKHEMNHTCVRISLEEIIKNNLWVAISEQYKEWALGEYRSYFSPLLAEIKEFGDKECLKKDILELHCDVESKVIWLRLLLIAECFDGELMKQYLDALRKLPDKELVICLLYEIVWIEISHGEYIYPEYYNDRKKLMYENTKMLLGDYEMRTPKPFCKCDEIRKVCILRQNLPGLDHSPTRLTVAWANRFCELGYEVTVFVTGLLQETNLGGLMRFDERRESFCVDEVKQQVNEKVRIISAKGKHIRDKLINTIEAIEVLSPDVIMDACGDYNMLSGILWKYYPTVYVSVRGYHSCSYAHRFLFASEGLFDLNNDIYQSVDKKFVFFKQFKCYERKEKTSVICLRKEYGIAENAFVCVTTGNRAEKEITKEFADCMAELLTEQSHVIWIIVGPGEFSYLKGTYESLVTEGRIRLWGYDTEFDTFFRRVGADVLVMPNTSGNGGCISGALENDVPVLMNKTLYDIGNFIGVQNMVAGDCRELMKELNYMVRDKVKLHKLLEAEKKVFGQGESPEKHADLVIEAAVDFLSNDSERNPGKEEML